MRFFYYPFMTIELDLTVYGQFIRIKIKLKTTPKCQIDQFNRSEVPRMPWRDQGSLVIGHGARDLARHFIQRWNQTKVINPKTKKNTK
jgi:phosphatidylserine/phosphatidylglycerophosphate/cardiolipin synthase-like enzyme